MTKLGSPRVDYNGLVGLAASAKMPASILAFRNEELNDVARTRHVESKRSA